MANKILFVFITMMVSLLAVTFACAANQIPSRAFITNFEALAADNATNTGSGVITGGIVLSSDSAISNPSQDIIKSTITNDKTQLIPALPAGGVPEFSPLTLGLAVVGAGMGLVFLRKK